MGYENLHQPIDVTTEMYGSSASPEVTKTTLPEATAEQRLAESIAKRIFDDGNRKLLNLLSSNKPESPDNLS